MPMTAANIGAQKPPVRVKVLKPFWVDGKLAEVGSVVTVQYDVALDLRARGRVADLEGAPE